MTKPKESLWDIEPHTLAKHEILKRYLEAWFPILATYNPRIVYLDGFSGPGRYKGGEDGSPIIALKQALSHFARLHGREITFLFIDERSDRIDHLKAEIASIVIPPNFSIHLQVAQFEDTLTQILGELKAQNLNLAPTFAFIDPFGFKGIPYSLVKQLLSNPKSEVFINIMVDFINRFVEHPDITTRQHIIDLIGNNQALEVITQSGDRVTTLRKLYQAQLEACAKYVRYFEMYDSRDRLIYCLFFATNHPLGFIKMKEAFWKVDPESGFHFSDATNPNQMILFSIDPSQDLAQLLMEKFSTNRKSVAIIRQFVEEETVYIAKHMRSALAILESQNKIQVASLKSNGQKRRKGTFSDDVVIQFI